LERDPFSLWRVGPAATEEDASGSSKWVTFDVDHLDEVMWVYGMLTALCSFTPRQTDDMELAEIGFYLGRGPAGDTTEHRMVLAGSQWISHPSDKDKPGDFDAAADAAEVARRWAEGNPEQTSGAVRPVPPAEN
jgi:hypothetical protein